MGRRNRGSACGRRDVAQQFGKACGYRTMIGSKSVEKNIDGWRMEALEHEETSFF